MLGKFQMAMRSRKYSVAILNSKRKVGVVRSRADVDSKRLTIFAAKVLRGRNDKMDVR